MVRGHLTPETERTIAHGTFAAATPALVLTERSASSPLRIARGSRGGPLDEVRVRW
jgi:hypothetical protein